jgi:flagellar assembly protein FliH
VSREKAVLSGKSGQVVFDYRPKEFPIVVSESAKDFSSKKHATEHSGAFTINPLIAQKAGISRMQAESLEKAVEAQALERLKDIQERAYREAFELGLLEGTEKAFEEHREEFAARLSYLDSILKSFEDLKSRLVAENEAQMVTLVFEIAKRLALREIAEHPETILDLIRKVAEDSQTDERLVIKVSQEDLTFIENLAEASQKDKEMLQKIRLEADAKVASGGCVLETNYGSIDASLQQRVGKIWDVLSSRAPKIQASELGLPVVEENPPTGEGGDDGAGEGEGEKS